MNNFTPETDYYHSSNTARVSDPAAQFAEDPSTIRGIITDIERQDFHYGRLYKFFRSVLRAEPFQLRKTRNPYGSSCVYTHIRIMVDDGDFTVKDITVPGEIRGILSCGDEVVMHVRQTRNGNYFQSGYNNTTDSAIRRDSAMISPVGVYAILGVCLALAAWLIISLITWDPSNTITGLHALFTGLAAALMPLFTFIILIIFLIRWIFRS